MTRRVYVQGLIVLLSATCLASIASAQTSWWRIYGGSIADQGRSVQQTADGGFVVAGLTYSYGAGSDDIYLIKTNASGDTLWTRTYGGTGSDEGYSVQQTADGGYIVAGMTTSFGAGGGDVYLVKTNASGDTLWTKTYGGTGDGAGYSVSQTTDGGYIVAGLTTVSGDSEIYLIKTDRAGDTQWTRTYGGPHYDIGFSMQQTTDGGYIITGCTFSFGIGTPDCGNVYLVKTNAQGDTLWTRTFGGTDHDLGNSVRQTSDGGYVVVGYTRSFGAGGSDVYLIKTDNAGETLWTRTYGGRTYDWGNSVQQTSDGGYIITGSYVPPGGEHFNVCVIRTSSSGDTLWTRAHGGNPAGGADGKSVQQSADGGYIIAGWIVPSAHYDVYLVKTDSLGNVGVADEDPNSRAPGRRLAATIVRNLPQGATVFDAMGRRVLYPKPGVYFLRSEATTRPRKVLLVK